MTRCQISKLSTTSYIALVAASRSYRNRESYINICGNPLAFLKIATQSLLCMGRGPTTAASLQDYARVASERIRAARVSKPVLRSLDSSARVSVPSKGRAMEEGEGRLRLSDVVADCVKRWFQDTLKEARDGDTAMQVLVGQMYHNGYGVPRNEQKAKAWLTKAARYRSSVWKVGDKRPGYNASDSDSDKEEAGAKS